MRMLNVPRSRVGFNVRKVEILTELAALLNHPRARDLGGVPATKIAKNLGLTTKLVLTLLVPHAPDHRLARGLEAKQGEAQVAKENHYIVRVVFRWNCSFTPEELKSVRGGLLQALGRPSGGG